MPGFIMAGRMQAAIFVIVSTLLSLGLPPMIVFCNAAIALITLRKGWQQGIIYALIATATLIAFSALRNQGPLNGLLAGLINWLPIVVVASVLAITNSWAKTLQLILLVGIVSVMVFHLFNPDAAAFWKNVLEPVKPLLKSGYDFSDTKIDELINKVSQWMTGTFAAALTLLSIISLIIARNWQAILYNPGGFGEEFRQIKLGKQLAIGLLIGIALAVLTNNQMITELIMLALAIFMFQGLSLAHAVVKQREMHTGWLVALYISLFLLMIQVIVLLATFGLIDNFVDFRQRYSSKK